MPQFGSTSITSIIDNINARAENYDLFAKIDPPKKRQLHRKHENLYNHLTIEEQHLSSLIKDHNNGNDAASSSSSNIDFGVAVDDTIIDVGTENNNISAAFEILVPRSYDTVTQLPSATVAQIHLANILLKHKCDLNILNEVTKWANHHSIFNDVNWKYSNLMTRKKLMSTIETFTHSKNLKPHLKGF